MDVVVTVPRNVWGIWCREGDLPGDEWSGREYKFTVGGRPNMVPGDRVYIVANNTLRGYAPLIRLQPAVGGRCHLIRAGGAVALTINQAIRGFRGFRYRWWEYSQERHFANWRQL